MAGKMARNLDARRQEVVLGLGNTWAFRCSWGNNMAQELRLVLSISNRLIRDIFEVMRNASSCEIGGGEIYLMMMKTMLRCNVFVNVFGLSSR